MEARETQAKTLRLVCASGAVVAVLLIAAPAGDGVSASARGAADVTVTANGIDFTPAEVTINQGETVSWTNTGGTHDVVFPDGFRQPPQATGPGAAWPVSRTFTSPGTFSYYCSVHQSQGMTGTVTVVPPPGGPPPPGGGTPPPGGGTPPPGGGTPPPGGGTPPPGGGTPPPGGGNPPPGGRASTTVTLQVSDATPTPGARVRFFGTVRPEQDGRLVQLQRRVRGSFRTVLRIKLTDAGSARSKFSNRLRVLGDAVFRARLPADSAHEAGTSRARRLDVR